MKISRILIVLPLLLVLYACPGASHKSDLKKIQENNMDLPDLRDRAYSGIRFKLSDLFRNSYNDDFVIQDNAKTMAIYGIDLNFSVEVFDKDEAELIQFAFDDEISALDAVHDNYVLKRMETFEEGEASIKKPCSKDVKYPGYTQVLHGKNLFYGDMTTYMMATVEIDNEYYVFQLIGKRENMGYLFDDFEDILVSITK
jgi:hypothetical protein